MQHVNMYHAIRVGRKCWALGQIGGIFIRSIVLTVVAVICTILPLLPDIEWSNEWGKLLRTAATTRALTQFDSSDRKSTRLNSSHRSLSRMPSSA